MPVHEPLLPRLRARAPVLRAATVLLMLAVPAAAAQPRLVFITKSDACSCQRNLCASAEQEVVNFLADSGDRFQLVRIDLAETPGAARAYKAFAVPVVILEDGDGNRVARFDAVLTERDLAEAWGARQKRTAR